MIFIKSQIFARKGIRFRCVQKQTGRVQDTKKNEEIKMNDLINQTNGNKVQEQSEYIISKSKHFGDQDLLEEYQRCSMGLDYV